ncbi:hypothetical protein FOCC_FOCC000489 [Frankliniella occidentalis]|nr:hypothetical protein FOCC_FOCC000489 [Frankliniella occidentalis]
MRAKRIHEFSQERINTEFGLKSPAASTKRKAPKASGGGRGGPSSSGSAAADLFHPKKRITQEDVNRAVDEFVICTRQSHRVVDNEYFKKLALLGLPDNLKINCRQTLKKRLEMRFQTMRNNLLKELDLVKYVAASADGWSKFRRGFLGVVATWLDPQNLERRFAALALQRLKGRHTHDRLGKALIDIFASYGLQSKLVMCTTDSGSNFLKAFKVHGAVDLPQAGLEEEDEEQDSDAEPEAEADEPPVEGDEEFAVLDLDNILDAAELDGAVLPPHTRCGAHILNGMATTDVKAVVDANAAFKKIFDSTEGKLRKYWRLQSKSTLVAESIQEGIGVKLVIPGETRWNSRFDAKKQIVSLIEKNPEKFNEVVDKTGLPKLLPSEIKFLKEYVHVMTPVAFALDILQRDKNMYLGFLIPTILSMEKLLSAAEYLDNRNLKYCEPLVTALRAAVRNPRRFYHQLNNRDLEIAAALLPCFMLHDWITTDAKRQEIKAAILEEMKKVDLNQTASVTNGGGSAAARPTGVVRPGAENDESEADADDPGVQEDLDEDLLSAEDRFFGFRPARIVPTGTESTVETAEQELQRFLDRVDRTWTVKRCFGVGPNGQRDFPRLAELFMKFNTGLPSSAAIERFFSLAGLAFCAIRTALGDITLEQETILCVNKQFWCK